MKPYNDPDPSPAWRRWIEPPRQPSFGNGRPRGMVSGQLIGPRQEPRPAVREVTCMYCGRESCAGHPK